MTVEGIGTRRGTRGGCWVIMMPRLLGLKETTASANPDTTSYRRGFRTFLHLRQPPQTKGHDDDGQVP